MGSKLGEDQAERPRITETEIDGSTSRWPTHTSRAEAGVESERSRLVGAAFRMLGTVAEAEDAVQDAFVRWYRLDESERAGIMNAAAWLTRVTSRICLDMLGSARARREKYVGPWLPEPVPGSQPVGEDPAESVSLDESVSTAMLLVMERMTPAERVSFVLHDVFGYSFDEVAQIVGRRVGAVRQLASSARRRLRAERRRDVSPVEHVRVVEAFRAAASGGDLAGLTGLLDPSVVLTSDGGGVVRAARNRIFGPDKVARFVLGVLERQHDVRLAPGISGDGAAVLFVVDGQVTGVVNVGRTEGGSVGEVWIQWNPQKLTRWASVIVTGERLTHSGSVSS